MLPQFLKPAQLLDETSILWMFDTFAWALRNFDSATFFNETILVTPSNTHFPGKESSPDGMVNLIFDQVKVYAGMQHWPFRLENQTRVEAVDPVRIPLKGAVRGKAGMRTLPIEGSEKQVIVYSQRQLGNPEVLIANLAHSLAHYLGTTANEAPPGGEENWGHVTELLAVFLGFGIMMADSANTTKIRSCGSCTGPAIERENFLSQYDITYALAIFCCLKDIPVAGAAKNLKSSLRPFFKKAMKDVKHRKIHDSLRQVSG